MRTRVPPTHWAARDSKLPPLLSLLSARPYAKGRPLACAFHILATRRPNYAKHRRPNGRPTDPTDHPQGDKVQTGARQATDELLESCFVAGEAEGRTLISGGLFQRSFTHCSVARTARLAPNRRPAYTHT